MDDRAPFAALLRVEMTRQSLTLQDVADRVQRASGRRSRVTRQLVSRWRSGAVTPSAVHVRWLCEALNVELPVFARAAAVQRPSPPTASFVGPLRLSLPNASEVDYLSVTESPQQVVCLDNLLVADNGLLVTWQINRDQLEELERIHANLNARSEVEPPQSIAPELANWLSTLRRLIQRGEPELARRRLQAMAARTACHLGYLAFRELDQVKAFDNYALAEALARDAHDDLELSVVLLRKQRLYPSSAASEIVDSVATMAHSGWPSGVTAWVWGERARLDAVAGREASAQQAIATAMSAAANDPDHLNLFAPGRDSRWLARRPAWVALRLGHTQEAITMLERNRSGADEGLPREMVWNSIELAEAWAQHGDLDCALDYLGDALDRATETEDRRGAAHVVRVRSRRLAPWAKDRRLRQFDERIQTGATL